MSNETTAIRAIPRALERYPSSADQTLAADLAMRVQIEPFNAIATSVFVLAIFHTLRRPVRASRAPGAVLRQRNGNYTEPLFVVVIMSLASTRPVIGFERLVDHGRPVRRAGVGGMQSAAGQGRPCLDTLGHVTVQTEERYLGRKQKLRVDVWATGLESIRWRLTRTTATADASIRPG